MLQADLDAAEKFEAFAKQFLANFEVRKTSPRIDGGAHEGRYRDGVSGTVWGGSSTQDYCWVFHRGSLVQEIKVGEERTPTPWYVNGSFLRSIYRNP